MTDVIDNTSRNPSLPESRLTDIQGLIPAVWPDPEARPSVRYIRKLQAERRIPYKKIGTRVYFDPAEVRRAIDRQFTVHAA